MLASHGNHGSIVLQRDVVDNNEDIASKQVRAMLQENPNR